MSDEDLSEHAFVIRRKFFRGENAKFSANFRELFPTGCNPARALGWG